MALLWLRRPCTTSSRDTCAMRARPWSKRVSQGGRRRQQRNRRQPCWEGQPCVGHKLGGGRPPQKHNGRGSCGAGAHRKGKEGKADGNEEGAHLVGCLQLLTVEGQIEVGDGLFPPELDGRQVIRQRSGRLAVVPSQVHLLARLPDVALVPAGTGPGGRPGRVCARTRQAAGQPARHSAAAAVACEAVRSPLHSPVCAAVVGDSPEAAGGAVVADWLLERALRIPAPRREERGSTASRRSAAGGRALGGRRCGALPRIPPCPTRVCTTGIHVRGRTWRGS
jgi:hypothetical protein